jgi:hypothetical protein
VINIAVGAHQASLSEAGLVEMDEREEDEETGKIRN